MATNAGSGFLGSTAKFLKSIRSDFYILAGLLILSITGVALADAFVNISLWYWLAMVPVFFAASVFIDWKNTFEPGQSFLTLLIKQFAHWAGLMVVVYIAFMLRGIGSLDNTTTGLMLLSSFALATYLAGDISGWVFRLLGMFLAASLVIVAYMEHYIWVIIGVSLFLLAAYQFIMHRKSRA